jgi:hypothetical protein
LLAAKLTMPRLYYFQAPNFDINPESDTAPRLGSIFPNLDRLTGPLNQLDHVHVPTNLMNNSASINYTEAVSRNLEGSTGLSVNTPQGIGGSAGLVYAFARDKNNLYRCELLNTEEFEPTKEFVYQSILASQRVQTFLEESLVGRKRVYMITGLKIATGFSRSTSDTTQHNPKLKVAFDATVAGVPLETIPEVDLAIANNRIISHGPSTNRIVFAYRVIKIKLRRDGEVKYRFMDGGKYSTDVESHEETEPWEIEPLYDDDRFKDFPDSVEVETEHEPLN